LRAFRAVQDEAGIKEDPKTQNYKLKNQPHFNNQRRGKLDKSLSSEVAGNLESLERLDS